MPERLPDWLTPAIAVYGAVVATCALAWNIYIGLRDRSAVRVEVRRGLLPTVDPDRLMILLEAVNRGRRPVTLTAVGLRLSDGGNFFLTKARLPVELTEGQSHTEWITEEKLREYPIEADHKGSPLFGWYKDATGRLYKGKLGRLGRATMRGTP